MLLPGENAEEMQRPERVWKLLARWVGPDDVEVVRSAVYSFHALLARRWRHRRLLLAGDSAHQMPPFLGQGMCSGIRDVANLAWKLALIARGQAGERLLDSYQLEREPHVRWIVETAVALGRIIQSTDRKVAEARDAQLLAGDQSAVPRDPRLPGLVAGLFERRGDAVAGELFPQSRVRTASGEGRLLDDVLGPNFALVSTDDPRAGLPSGSIELLQEIGTRVVVLRREPPRRASGLTEVQEIEPLLGPWHARHGAALVRPDRYVFGVAARPAELERLVGILRERLAR
jgi:3-(3-hydroxy-phenyl)propionate hydroxylase